MIGGNDFYSSFYEVGIRGIIYEGGYDFWSEVCGGVGGIGIVFWGVGVFNVLFEEFI